MHINNIMPKVVVILVNYNSLKHTKECIQSIKSSSYNNIDIVVLDNDSAEDCQELEDDFDDVVLIRNRDNFGFAVANNVGIEYALQKGAEYILLLNNDTIVDKNCIEKLVKHGGENFRSGIVTGKILNYYERDLIWYAGGDLSYLKGDVCICGFGKRDIGQYNVSRECTFASGCCMLIPKEIAREFRLSEDYFLYYEDCDYCVKLIKNGKKIYYCSSAVVFHKESATTDKHSCIYSYYFARNRLLFIKKNVKLMIRIIPYVVTVLTMIKRCWIGLLRPGPVLDGMIDFVIGKVGKCKRSYE